MFLILAKQRAAFYKTVWDIYFVIFKIYFDFILETDFRYGDEGQRKPPVPKHTEKPVMGIKSNKNFINTNAVENIMSVPKKPAANFADSKHGATHPLEPSGLTPKYVNKKDYGKTPNYLIKRNKEVEEAQKTYDQYIQDSMQRGAMKCLSETERYFMFYCYYSLEFLELISILSIHLPIPKPQNFTVTINSVF